MLNKTRYNDHDEACARWQSLPVMKRTASGKELLILHFFLKFQDQKTPQASGSIESEAPAIFYKRVVPSFRQFVLGATELK